METQLTLVETPRAWKLDQRTRDIGRRGVAEARAALRRATPPADTSGRTEAPAPVPAPSALPDRRRAAGGREAA